MSFATLFFDLDDTLYPARDGLWNAIRDRMSDYMVEKLHLPPEDVPVIRRHYFETYGTTLRGLQMHHHVDADEFLAYVHDLPLSQYIHPDPAVRALLLGLPQPRWIFTNADAAHAQRVLAVLELSDCFQGIIDVRALGFICKPEPEAYQRALALAGAADPRECLYLDDSPRNLAPARAMGITTVLVGTTEPHPAACYSIAGINDLSALRF